MTIMKLFEMFDESEEDNALEHIYEELNADVRK